MDRARSGKGAICSSIERISDQEIAAAANGGIHNRTRFATLMGEPFVAPTMSKAATTRFMKK
jgi:hypothetical protein